MSDLTKADKKKVRQLAGIAWERELRHEILGIMTAINEMENGSLSPFDVNDRIHKFHNGASRDLYRQYSESLPWLGVCRAFFDRVLTDDDLVDASLSAYCLEPRVMNTHQSSAYRTNRTLGRPQRIASSHA